MPATVRCRCSGRRNAYSREPPSSARYEGRALESFESLETHVSALKIPVSYTHTVCYTLVQCVTLVQFSRKCMRISHV